MSAILLLSLLGGAYALNCTSQTFSTPVVEGARILSIAAQVISSFGGTSGNDVCFVNVTLTHPGTNDGVNNYYTLPLNNYNDRFQGQGGAGWAAGNPFGLATANAEGYAAGTTDAGHELSIASAQDASGWALLSPGNVNQYLLLNFARRSVHDMTVVGKQITASFYGKEPCWSYFNGCSNGGRQGLQSAQFYPDDYDGILAGAPAVQWTSLVTFGAWSWSLLTDANYYPDLCEFQGVVDAVTAACDELDGLKDNMISAPGLCKFDPSTIVGKQYTCFSDGSKRTFSSQIAEIVKKAWAGPHTPQGQFLWWGLLQGANFTGLYMNKNTGNVENTPRPFQVSDSWIRAFIAKDLSFNTSTIKLDQYSDLFLKAHLEYDSTMASASPDLRAYKRRGGKIISWQGLADQLVNPQGTITYYQGVQARDHSVHDFYRLFFTPGVGHCQGGIGAQPIDPIAQLRDWVENGTAPATLKAGSAYPINSTSSAAVNATQNVRFLDLCPWPSVTKYNGKGDPNLATSYSCATERGWLDFQGPNGRDYDYFTAPGWYGGDSNITQNFA
ncbi:hypothetical protein AMS68_000718 [Peltaster fructicola]|uniref:Carboxylic ester hydrolase n=1 Tax=Peltaster fructicola TaxID=286661 RepID=A0A6H0XKP1_9PEZI|nr:hypothetical protein AMS68_000718 [Peltaster fructicola]